MPICSKSKVQFEVPQADLDFLERISPTFANQKFLLPPPTLAPLERIKRRTAHRNERFIYTNKSAFTGEKLVSIYRPDTECKIVKQKEWFSDQWDPLSFGRDFDFNQLFFAQFHELQKVVPRANVVSVDNENSDYTTGTGYCKNCYLINSSEYCEDCFYGKLFQKCTNVVDSAYCYDSELLYECFNAQNCYDCKYVYNSQNTSNSWFCDNLTGCQHCFLCTNLSSKNHYFENQQLSKENYEEKVGEIISDPEKFKNAQNQFVELRKNRIYKYANIINSENSKGDFMANCKNCEDCFDINDSEDCHYVQVGVNVKDLLDCSNMYVKPELSYETLGTIGTYNIHFCIYVFHSNNMWYSEQCFSCQDCFACIGLRHKQYCLFNKQYSKEEYENKVAEIIAYMQKTKEWGEFFPVEISPFGYNESLASEYNPLTRDEAIANGFVWSDYQPPKPQVAKIAPADKLPFDIKQIPDEILDWAIECAETKKLFQLQKAELAFYHKMNLAIPHLHPDVRYDNRMKLRNARTLYHRVCDKKGCNTEFDSTFSPKQPEKIYCEKCYLAEVY